MYRVFYSGSWPKKKKNYFPGKFEKRKQARNFCRNHQYRYSGLHIEHPDGTVEAWEIKAYY